MDVYQQLAQYQYPDLDEVEKSLSEENPHFFIPVTHDEIDRISQVLFERLGVSFPAELVSFWETVGAGELFAMPSNQNIGRYEILDPASILGIYFEEDDFDELYNTIRLEAHEDLETNNLLAFCMFSEYSALYISLESGSAKGNAVYYCNQKIADSFAEYIRRLIEEPDYFIDKS